MISQYEQPTSRIYPLRDSHPKATMHYDAGHVDPPSAGRTLFSPPNTSIVAGSPSSCRSPRLIRRFPTVRATTAGCPCRDRPIQTNGDPSGNVLGARSLSDGASWERTLDRLSEAAQFCSVIQFWMGDTHRVASFTVCRTEAPVTHRQPAQHGFACMAVRGLCWSLFREEKGRMQAAKLGPEPETGHRSRTVEGSDRFQEVLTAFRSDRRKRANLRGCPGQSEDAGRRPTWVRLVHTSDSVSLLSYGSRRFFPVSTLKGRAPSQTTRCRVDERKVQVCLVRSLVSRHSVSGSVRDDTDGKIRPASP